MPLLHRNSFAPRVNVDTRALNERLRSTYGLSSSERSEIREILALAEQDVAAYDAEMHRMRLRREGLKQYADKLSTLLSPIRRLPNELLVRIFEECCEKNDLTEDNPGSALTISAVCTRWRDLSVSHPVLWSSLGLFLGEEDYDGYGYNREKIEALERSEVRLVSTVELYSKRSQNHPLILDITVLARADDTEHRALVMLAQQSVRWKSLIYRGSCFSPDWSPCLEALPLPLLQTAEFFDWYGEPGSSPVMKAPRVIELSFDVRVDSDTVETFSASWGSLARLSCHTTKCFETLWEILDLCPKLNCLSLHGFNAPWCEEYVRRSDPPKTLPSVSSFTIANQGFCTQYDTLECVLVSLTLPNLTDLTLEQDKGPKTEPIPKPYTVINHFLARSKCSLTSLTMNKICLADKELVSLLLYLPSLQELSLTDPLITGPLYRPISNSFIQSLHTWQRSHLRRSFEPLVPNLRSLTLEPMTSRDFDSSLFVDTISSRWLPDDASSEFGVVCLRSVELHLPETVTDSEVYEPLKRFDAAGMRVVVKCKGMEGYLV